MEKPQVLVQRDTTLNDYRSFRDYIWCRLIQMEKRRNILEAEDRNANHKHKAPAGEGGVLWPSVMRRTNSREKFLDGARNWGNRVIG